LKFQSSYSSFFLHFLVKKNCGIISSFTFQTFHIHLILLFINLPYTVLISNSLLSRFLSYFSVPIYVTKQHSIPINLKIRLIFFSKTIHCT
jgi:hypothetical protein